MFPEGGLNVPVVMLLVEGGRSSVELALQSATQGIPLLVCDGTGRAANLISKAVRRWRQNEQVSLYSLFLNHSPI